MTPDQLNLPIPSAEMLAKSDDPSTSHKAAAEVAANSGQMNRLYQRVLDMVEHCPDYTTSELAAKFNVRDPRMIGRRLPELERAGKVVRGQARACKVTGKAASVWRAV